MKMKFLFLALLVFLGGYFFIDEEGGEPSKENLSSANSIEVGVEAKNDKVSVQNDYHFEQEKKEPSEEVAFSQKECHALSSSDKKYLNQVVTKFTQENVIFPSSVLPYLTELNEEQLILEFESGNNSAAYVLGMNHFYSSYNSNWHNPYLGPNVSSGEGKPINFEPEAMEKAREWLWKAAINDIPIALLELGNTYRYESAFYKKENFPNLSNSDFHESDFYKRSKSKELAYKVLFEEVTSGYRELSGKPLNDYESQMDKLQFEGKIEEMEGIRRLWSLRRSEAGKGKIVELLIPKEVNESITRMKKQC